MNARSSLRRLIVFKSHCVKIVTKTTAASVTAKPSTRPSIQLSKSRARVDEEVCITATGLQGGQKVTIQTFVYDSKKGFGACGHYVANSEGTVNTFDHESHGGTFDGVEPMGLFWSMRSCPGLRPKRILNENPLTPFTVDIALHSGFVDFDQLPWTRTFDSLSSCQFHQEFVAPGVKRIHVTENGLKGFLFLPPGEGPFPAVIDMFGMANVLYTHRSALLASSGIASFIVDYMGEGLAASSEFDVDYSYFLKAFDWLAEHPSIDSNALGGVGSCAGGAYLSIVAWKRPAMKCMALINAANWPSGPDQTVEGEYVESRLMNVHLADRKDGVISFRNLFFLAEKIDCLPYWRHGAKVLHIVGEDDQCIYSGATELSLANASEEIRKNIEIISYPGAGHIIEPPFMPLCRTNYNTIFKSVLLWGGQPKLHAHAQMDSWPRVLSFLKDNLSASKPSSSTTTTTVSQHQ